MTITVLFIGGVGRSGSSMIERLLDQFDDIVSLGEIHQIFSHWIQFDKRQLCGCGCQFQECLFWRDVFSGSLGDMDDFEPDTWSDARKLVLGDQRRRELLFDIGSQEYFSKLNEFLDKIGLFYKQISSVSGSKIIVDSSKSPLWAAALQRIEGLDVRFLHFIRNPYATAYSWQRKRRRPEIWWDDCFMPVFSPAEVATRWRAGLVTSLFAARKVAKYKRVYYEDFVKSPSECLKEIMVFAGSQFDLNDEILDGCIAKLKPGHTVMGNPVRFSQEIMVKEDNEWVSKLSPQDRRQVSKYVWPFRLFYKL